MSGSRPKNDESIGFTDYWTNKKRMETVRTYRGPVFFVVGSMLAAFTFWMSATYLTEKDAKATYVTKEKFDSEKDHMDSGMAAISKSVEKTNDLILDLIREGI